MRHYELVTILSPMLNQDEASEAWDEIKSFISNRDGEITAEQIWGTRRLAYPIRKGNYNFLEGAYYLSSFTVDNSFNRELENYLGLDERVLRSLIVNCEGPLPDKPPPGPLTAPSRYIPPGRGRRGDGGGPIPEAPNSFAERRQGGPPPAADASAAPATDASAAPVADAPATPDDAAATATADAPATVVAQPEAVAAPEPVATPEPAAAPEPAATPEPAAAPEPAADPAPPAQPEAAAEPQSETDGEAQA